MPEDIKTPKPEDVPVYIAWLFSDVRDMKKTLDKFVREVPTRKEYDEHVSWGAETYSGLDKRLETVETKVEELEVDKKMEDNSVWANIRKGVRDTVVSVIAMVIVIGFLWLLIKTSQPEDVLQIIR